MERFYRDIQPPQKDAGAPLVKTRSFWNISSIWHSIHFIEISIAFHKAQYC